MSVQDVLALPEWERGGWKAAFDVWGPLDFRREDWRDARQFALNVAGAKGKKISDFILFQPPELRKPLTEDDILGPLNG
jgi:hypothetical protein